MGRRIPVYQILDAAAQMSTGISARVGVDLLGHVLLERQRRDFDGRNVSEAQEVRPTQHFWLESWRISEPHVYRDLFKWAPVNLRGDVVAHR